MVNNICAVSCCGKESYPGCGLSFHSLPSDLELKRKWLEVIPGNLHQSSVVCSLHFNREDYRTEARKKLKPGVIPSIFPKPNTGPDESDLQKEIKQDENIPEKTPIAKKVLLTVESSRGITLIKAQPVPSTSSTSAVPLVSLEEQIQVKKLEEKCDSLKRKVKTLNEKVRRQKKKIENFENIIKDLQEKIL